MEYPLEGLGLCDEGLNPLCEAPNPLAIPHAWALRALDPVVHPWCFSCDFVDGGTV